MIDEVNFSNQALKLDDANSAKIIVDTIENNPNLVTLNLEGNTLGIQAAESISNALKKAKNLKYALFKDLFTGRLKTEIPDALKHLTNGITESKAKLIELDLSDNAFGPIGMKALVDFLGSESCSDLKILKLNNNGLGIQGATLLATVLYKLTKLEVLICGRNRLENEGSFVISNSLKNLKLKNLTIPQNGIQVLGMKELSNSLKTNNELVELNLSDNTITVEGAKFISESLKNLKNLKIVNLSDCLLHSDGFLLILEALNSSGCLNELQELILTGNEIKSQAINKFVETFIKIDNKNLKIDLSNNNFGSENVTKILNKLKGKFFLVINDDEGEDEDDDENENIDNKENSVIDQKIDKLINSPDTSIDELVSSIINLSIDGFDNEKQQVSQKVLKQSEKLFEAITKKHTYSYKFVNNLLVEMGLLKDENKKHKEIKDLRGPFLTLKNLIPKLDQEQKDALQIFIGNKSSKKIEQTGKIKSQLLQSLFN